MSIIVLYGGTTILASAHKSIAMPCICRAQISVLHTTIWERRY